MQMLLTQDPLLHAVSPMKVVWTNGVCYCYVITITSIKVYKSTALNEPERIIVSPQAYEHHYRECIIRFRQLYKHYLPCELLNSLWWLKNTGCGVDVTIVVVVGEL